MPKRARRTRAKTQTSRQWRPTGVMDHGSDVFALLLVAASLSLSNFAAAIGIGLSGVDARLRIRVAVAFGLFEAGMPLLGLALGHRVAGTLGSHANWVAGGLLAATGILTIVTFWKPLPWMVLGISHFGIGRLLVSACALSIDNLIVGFALGAYRVPVVLAALMIAVASVVLSLLGLELGRRLGQPVERNAEILSGGVYCPRFFGDLGAWSNVHAMTAQNRV